MTTLRLRNSISRSPLRLGIPYVQPIWIIRRFVLLPFALGCFALSPTARAVLPPPAPDGGYPNNNTAEGTNALFSLTTGFDNTANGYRALYSNKSGNDNTANGAYALQNNATGNNNTANGSTALASNTTGSFNTATGDSALNNNTTGSNNTANGYRALSSNITVNGVSGHNNTATGADALVNNSIGSNNTANGYQALFSSTTIYDVSGNVSGNNNTATGFQALYGQVDAAFNPVSTGSNNTANGYRALYSYTTGGSNTANGYLALYFNTTGNNNTANGRGALYNNTTGGNNVTLGYQAGFNLTTGNNNIDIGNVGLAAEASTIRIGTATNQTRAFIAGIRGKTTANANAVPVVIDSAGQLGTVSSSGRFKKEIKPMDQSSEAILALKPVTFHYKSDSTGTPQFGLIAEEVAKVNPDLVVRDDNGEIYTVRYEAVNAMLLNEFLKEHRTIQELKSTVAEQQRQIKALASGLEKVSAQLQLNKPAPQTVVNNN